MKNKRYSVLMAVYYKENPEYLRQAIKSILEQTVPTDDFVLVCDGELSRGLNRVIKQFSNQINVIRLKKNIGLGLALNAGLSRCKNELVARMDSDDISLPYRCEEQLKLFENDPELGITSSNVSEFSGNPDNIVGSRDLPQSHDEIVEYSKKRNPFNHPSVMFKKSEVQEVGGYSEEYRFFEDYDLWVRMLNNGVKAHNSPEPLLKMRVSDDMYRRRGGGRYARNLLKFHGELKRIGWINSTTFVSCAIPHAAVCVMPAGVRKSVYKKLRKNPK